MLGARGGRHAVIAAGVLALAFLGALHAAGQNNCGGKMVVLKDPTPRDPDPDLLFKTKPAEKQDAEHAARVAAYNQQRLTLVRRAAGQLASLSVVLKAALEKSLSPDTQVPSLTQEMQVAATIETLAAQVHNALAPPAPSGSHGAQAKNAAAAMLRPEPSQLRNTAEMLMRSAQDMKTEADSSRADTLSIGLIQRSADVHDLAASLRLGMLGILDARR